MRSLYIISNLLLTFILSSCIDKINLYDETKANKEVISEPAFFYSFKDETNTGRLELIIKTKVPTNIQTLKVQMPSLKHNKSWLFMLTQDDCSHSAFCYTWAAINGKPLSKDFFYDVAHLSASDLPPNIYYLNKTLGSTNGTGQEVRFHFTTTIAPEWDFMNVKTSIKKGYTKNLYRFYKKAGLVWGNIKELLNYGNAIAFHNVNIKDQTVANDIAEHLERSQQLTTDKLQDRFCKMIAEPDGNKEYIHAAQSLSDIETLTAQKDAIKLYPFKVKNDLFKIVIERFFRDNPIDIEALIANELKLPKEERKAIYVGIHSSDTSWINFLSWLNDTYGKDGDDSVWFPSQEEYYEYNYYRIHSTLHLEQIDENTIKLVIDLKGGEHFYFPSITVNLRGIKQEDIKELTSNDLVKGLSSGNFEDGIMVNIDCRKYLVEHAEHFVEKFEKDRSNTSNKTDALYFVNQLKESTRKLELLNRIKK